MFNPSTVRLGRKAIKTDTRTLTMAKYTASLPAPPQQRDWTRGVIEWGMLANDTLGDCTIAGCAHLDDVWSINAHGKMSSFTNQNAIDYYSRWCGYNPKIPSTDQGGVELDILTKWRNTDFVGHKILGFASIHPGNMFSIRQAINLFGGVYIGLALPRSAQGQTLWAITTDDGSGNTEPGSWGGHCVVVSKYDPDRFGCITWGTNMPITPAFWKKYVDEVYVVFGQDWLNAMGSPSGFDMAQLTQDLKWVA